MAAPAPTLVAYFPKPGQERAFLALLNKHWDALNGVGLVTGAKPRYWRGRNKETGQIAFYELFEWKDEEASSSAHQTPEVMAVWEPMGPLLENLVITAVEPVEPPF